MPDAWRIFTMKRILAFLFSMALVGASVPASAQMATGAGGWTPSRVGGGCALTLALDGTPGQNNVGVSSSTPTVTLPTTTGTTDLVGLFIYYNQTGNSVNGVSG